MTKINAVLNDTLNVIQLARETARIQGKQVQAEQLKPVVEGLRNLVNEARETRPSPVAGIAGQNDFQTLLAAANRGSAASPASGAPASRSPFQPSAASPAERAQVILAMSSGGMSDLDIARQMGLTRDEVRLVLNINR